MSVTAEIIDILDENGEVIGNVPREEAERDNHVTANVLVFLFTPAGKVWVQLRPKSKKHFPGMWDISACGGVHSGETPAKAAARETLEEAQLKVQLQHVESFLNVFPGQNGEEMRRMSHLFVGITDELPQADGVEVDGFKLWDPIKLRSDVEQNPGVYVPSFIVELDKALEAYQMSGRAPRLLKRTMFGNPVLRQTARRLSNAEISSAEIQELITDLRYTLAKKKYGVGLAAPQVGESVALSAIGIKPTPARPKLDPLNMVIINPVITETFGRRIGMWEGCMSCGMGKDTLFAKVPRYKKVKLAWYDEHGKHHEKAFEGFAAHVIQHETDHLNGVLFVDRVRDTKTYMMASEYRKRIANSKKV